MEKIVTVLVGPAGAGKSTYCKDELSDYFRISQDLMGKDGHKKSFLAALKTEDKIVIDRMGFSRDQRKFYLEEAKRAGYKTQIIVLMENFKTCFERIVTREKHPTIAAGDKRTAFQALNMFFNSYQEPRRDEADEIKFIGENTNYMLDIREVCKDKKVIVIGDVHGMFDEVYELLNKANYQPGEDVVIFCGDLIDRGPSIKEILNFARTTPLTYCVRGNHEDKFIRYLMGNKVNTDMMKETIEQTEGYRNDELLLWLMNLPYIIRWDKDNYVLHAGINPKLSIHRQNREFLMYARHFDPVNNSFSNKHSPNWWEHPRTGNDKIFFGHSPRESGVASTYAFSLDGGCVFGDVLRAYVHHPEAPWQMLEVPAHKAYSDKNHYERYVANHTLEYDDYVTKGLLNKKVKGDLVLYNYTDKCTFEGAWDDKTLQSRGIIFDSSSGETASFVMPKFFNLGENEITLLKNLPLNMDYEIFDKVDGSMITVSHHKGQLIVATRGSFESEQAKIAQSILSEKDYLSKLDKNISYIFEVVYPENRMSPGAYLVINYGDMRDLILLTAYNKNERGAELNRADLEKEAARLGCPIAVKFDCTIEEAIELQKTLPVEREGFVVRFANGLRVKIKGEEYLKMHRLLNGISPLSTWRVMKDGKVPQAYLTEIPDIIKDEVDAMVLTLENSYKEVIEEIKAQINQLPGRLDNEEDNAYFKRIGLWLKSNADLLEFPSAIFPVLRNQSLDKIVMDIIRPNSNKLE